MYQRIWPQLSKLNKSNTNQQSSSGGEGEYAGLLNSRSLTCNKGIEIGSAEHRRAWEAGQVDYYGRDSFSNIQQQLERNMAQHTQEYHPSQQRQTTPDKTTNDIKYSTRQTTPPSQNKTTNIQQTLPKETTPPSQNKTTNIQQTLSKETAPPLQQTNNLQKSSLKQTIPPTTGANITKSILKETTLHQQATSSSENTQSSFASTLPKTENKSSSDEHESSWSVKSTIVTTHTQGADELAGPTVVSQVVSETIASSSNHIPTVTAIQQKTDSTNASESSVTVKTANDHFAWFFDNLFAAMLYTINLCYLVFLVAFRRSKNSSIIHGNETSVQNPRKVNNDGKRVNQ